MKDDTQDFCEELVREFNELAPLLQEHVADYDDILPHVFMADVTRCIVSGCPCRQELVRYLNDALSNGAKEVQNLIAVSFVENLETEEQLERALQDVHAEALREEWRRQRE